MTKSFSRLGRILDGLCGDIWFVSIYIAICLRQVHTPGFFMEHPWSIWVLAIVTGICHAKQAAMADYYRQFHLYFLKGEDGSELDTCDELRSRWRSMPWRNNFAAKITLWFYANYTANQEITTPAMKRLRKELQSRYGKKMPPHDFRAEFRRLSLPLMKYTNILSFNWRSIALFISILAGQPWLYFAFELVVLNILLIYMVMKHESICRSLTAQLKEGKYQ